MSHKILVVTGSPRKKGNTNLLADAFIEGAKTAGNQVFRFNAGEANINGCLACQFCFVNEGVCKQDDDMQQAYKYLHECDVLVLASPIYFFTVSAQIKAFIDRMFCGIGKPFAVKATVLLTVQEDKDIAVADNAVNTYKSIIDYTGWENLGVISVPNVEGVGAIAGNPKLEDARKLGESIK